MDHIHNSFGDRHAHDGARDRTSIHGIAEPLMSTCFDAVDVGKFRPRSRHDHFRHFYRFPECDRFLYTDVLGPRRTPSQSAILRVKRSQCSPSS